MAFIKRNFYHQCHGNPLQTIESEPSKNREKKSLRLKWTDGSTNQSIHPPNGFLHRAGSDIGDAGVDLAVRLAPNAIARAHPDGGETEAWQGYKLA